MFAYPVDVRSLGRLPDEFSDDQIRPHLKSADRRIRSWVGEPAEPTPEAREALAEAEACVCLSLMVPVLNVFYTQGAPRYLKQVGEIEFMFHSPEQAGSVARAWMDRAKAAVRSYRETTSQGLDWIAI